MSNVWGQRIKLAIFGESHGPAIGVTIGGLPPGFAIDWAGVAAAMARRAPGGGDIVTARQEKDQWEILSGMMGDKTSGAPLCAIIRNQDARSQDYAPQLPRPGHVDYAAWVKYKGFADYRGGGHFSGRLTACLVFAGAIAQQLLESRGIKIGGRIHSIYNIADSSGPPEQLGTLAIKSFPVFDDSAGHRMKEAILKAKAQGDSLGGILECAAWDLPAGLGEPFFDSLESVISAMMFAIPGIKGIEFGDGFGLAAMTGYEANDQLEAKDGRVRLKSNHSGGINGGITNGNPLVLRLAVKPTSTIHKKQSTVDLQRMETTEVSFGGRHDPCIAPRALPAALAGLALCLLDFLMLAAAEGIQEK
jgi:chorismate synthase